MSNFKIDSSVPIPEAPEEPIQEEEPSRWVPFKPHKHKCRNNEHSPSVGRCTKCGDIFPCPSGNCGHFDCADPTLASLSCKGNGTDTVEGAYVVEA